jgi:hypothetical protein
MRPGLDILADVRKIVAERQKHYGPPLKNHERIAALWSVALGQAVTPQQVALCMALVKVSRLIEDPGHEDSVADLMGYAVCYADCGTPQE